MLLGFISLLLTVFQGTVSDWCVPPHLTTFMLPCEKKAAGIEGNTHRKHAFHISWSKRHLLSEGGDSNHCSQQV